MNKKQKSGGNLRFFSRFLKGFSGLFALGALASVCSIFFNFLLPQVIRLTVDSVIGDAPANLPGALGRAFSEGGARAFLRENLWVCALAAVGFAILSGVFTYLYRLAIAKGSEGAIKNLRDALYSHIQRLPYRWHISVQTGDIIQRCTSDVDVVRTFLSTQLMELFRTVALVALAMSFMYSMNGTLSTIALIFVPVTVAYSCIYYRLIAKRFQAADEAEGDLSARVQENLTGVRVVRAFGREAYEMERFTKANNLFADLWIRLGKVMGCYWGLGDLTTSTLTMTMVLVGTAFTVRGTILPGEYLVFLYYTGLLAWPIRSFGRILADMSKMNVSIVRLREILEAPEETEDENALTPPMDRDIVFSDVSFSYEEKHPVLKHLSFKIPAGSTFGVLGGTGSGKSTLTYLLTRLYDLPEGSGSITVGGVDLRNIRLSHVRKNVGLVLQEPFLFSRTIAENIAAFRPDAPLEEIRAAAKTAALDDAVLNFSEGYDTVVGERGVTLSGGQRQRVAIARTLLQGAPVMIFDDSLSAVDTETDQKIRAALAEKTGGATTILISHRINTLRRADCILVLENGRMAQMGTHDELSKEEGIYRRICLLQGAADTEGGEAL